MRVCQGMRVFYVFLADPGDPQVSCGGGEYSVLQCFFWDFKIKKSRKIGKIQRIRKYKKKVKNQKIKKIKRKKEK